MSVPDRDRDTITNYLHPTRHAPRKNVTKLNPEHSPTDRVSPGRRPWWTVCGVVLYGTAFVILYWYPFDFQLVVPSPPPLLGPETLEDPLSVIGHFVLLALPGFALGWRLRNSKCGIAFIAASAGVLAVILVEGTQLFVASRDAAVVDGVANACGFATGLALSRILIRSQDSRESR